VGSWAPRKRRQAGGGGISEYQTKAGPRFLIKYPVLQEDGSKRVVLKRGFTTRREAAAALRAEIRRAETGEWVHPSKQPLGAYLAEWLDGQRLGPATLASYRKNVRLHVAPYLGAVPMERLTGTAVDAWMRTLEASGRADGQGGLSPRTVRDVYTVLRSALADAVRHGRLAVNPTDRSTPPSPSQARPPEMHAWTAPELARFLRWVDGHDSEIAMAWRLLACTGMRRGEAWRCAGATSTSTPGGSPSAAAWAWSRTRERRAAGRGGDEDRPVPRRRPGRRHGRGAARLPDGPRLGRAGPGPGHRARAGHPGGAPPSPRAVLPTVRRPRPPGAQALGEEQLPMIRLHDLRHTHATLLLAAGEPVKVVSERLGHASATITLTVHQHVHPGMGREAAARFAALLDG
jgi:integrase